MDSKKIRAALGKLQAEPESEEAWNELAEAAATKSGDLSPEEFEGILAQARERHVGRGEWDAVARLLATAVDALTDTPLEVGLLREQARTLQVELFDDEAASIPYLRLLEIDSNDPVASPAVDEIEGKKGRSAELAKRYLDEAQGATDDVYKSSMLMHAAEMEVRFGGDNPDLSQAVERLEQAVRLDPSNEKAGRLLELVHRRAEKWEEVARVLERLADRAEGADQRVGAAVRLARVYAQHLSDQERAARAYEGALRLVPSHAEAMEFLTEFYSGLERWADLVALYERELAAKRAADADLIGEMLQIAMLYWKKLGSARAAEPWFARIAKAQPANEAMLAFYREYCAALGDDARLMDVLQTAQRSLKAGSKEKSALNVELGRLAEGQANAQKAIEQYKAVLRDDPDNVEAREKLKSLYKQTQSHNALVELLRQQLERTPADSYEARLAVLREVATIYREYIRSDTALLSVLNQIVQLDEKLDEHDAGEMREIVSLYEKLGRARDMIAHQLKLAEITPDIEEKKSLYRSAGRRWLEQFQNAQNSAEAYAALLALEPGDREARERLEELYRKRRAWKELYELFQLELGSAEGGAKSALLLEMAQLAAERLNRGADAVKLYGEILEQDSSRQDVLDALEKHAERTKDWAALADALERREKSAADDGVRLVALQKLGTVYAEHLNDPKSAARAWRRVLSLSPGHQRALRVLRDASLAGGDFDGLVELYSAQSDWEGLAEVLSTAADRAKDAALRIDLSYRAASVYEEKLGQPERAFRSYERILAADPSDSRAARALVPLYEKDEKWGRLPGLYESLVSRADSVDEKLELLRRLVEISGKHLSDKRAAANYARRAYELAPDSQMALDILEDASRAAGSWDAFVDALQTRLGSLGPSDAAAAEEKAEPAPPKKGKKKKKGAQSPSGDFAASEESAEPRSAPPADQRRLLELRVARVLDEELGRADEAIAQYRSLLERDPTDAQAAGALERILRRLDRRDDLRWLLDVRVTNAPSDAERVALLGEWATLEEEAFEATDRAAALYRRVLDLVPEDTTALTTLPRLLLSLEDAAGAAEVMERHRDLLGGSDRAEAQVTLAELYLAKLERPADALESSVEALGSAAQAERAVGVLERLLSVKSTRRRAAEVLAERYAKTGDARREASVLALLIDESSDVLLRTEIAERLATVYESKLGSYSNALDVMLRAVREAPAEIRLWERSETLAVSAGRPTDLADAYREVLRTKLEEEIEVELSERASRWHEDRLGDPIGATPYLERVLALRPTTESAFRRLKDILTAAERWGELESLYDRQAAVSDDPVRRVEMLAEVALVCEEIIEDPQKAMRHYERIMAIDPYHDASVRALDRLYTRAGKDRELADLLDRRLQSAVGEDALELKLRLARLQLALHEPDRAIAHVEDVLREKVNDHDARQLAERLLEIGTLKVRAARALEVVYESRDEVRDLVRVLEARIDSETDATPEERRDMIRRVAVFRNDRLHDDEGAFAAFAKLAPMDPADSEARDQLVTIGARLGQFDRVAKVLSEAAEATESAELKGEILSRVAELVEVQLNDRSRAEGVYRRVLELDPNDPRLALPAARALERLYSLANEPKKLAEMLRTRIRLEEDTQVRRELLSKLGELSETVLGDREGAITAWRSRLDEGPDDSEALAALDRLYEATQHHRDLVEVLHRRRELATAPDLRKTLLTRSAQVLWKKLDAGAEAIEEYQSLIDEFGPTREAFEALESLYRSAERWDDLAETFTRHLEVAGSDSERLALFAELGDLERTRRGDVTAALDVYRRALALDPRHAPSRTALDELLGSPEPAARREAAQLLRPLYENDGDNERLLKVLEIEVGATDDPLEQLAGLGAAMKVAEGPLGDPNRAFGYAERALKTAVGHADLTTWLPEIDRLAAATRRQSDHVKLLCDVAPGIFDGEVQLAVTLKIADLAKSELGDGKLARQYYDKALELRADEPRALAALESLYEETGDSPNLLGILERRAEVTTSDDDRRRLLYRRARLLAETEDRPKAIEVYESILDLGLEDDAIGALETLYTAVGRHSDLVSLYERQIDAKRGAEGDLRVKIASVAVRRLNDPERAFEELEQALGKERKHEGAIAELERLLAEAQQPEHRARAAELLEPVYLARADWGRVMSALKARLDVAVDPERRRDVLTRLAKLYEEQEENYRSALETTAQLLHEDLADEDTIKELERLARVAGAEPRLAEIYAAELETLTSDDPSSARLARRTGELFASLDQPDKALVFLRRALAFEPDSRPVFQAIDAILVRQKLHKDRVTLHREALDHRFDPGERLTLLHTIAALERRELTEPDAAIDTYRSALEVDDRDAVSLDALTELYRERKRWDDLTEVYLGRAELADTPVQGIGYRLALARLHLELSQTERAVDQLEEIVRQDAKNSDAIAELESLRQNDAQKERVVAILRPLYETADDWRRLVQLNEDRYALASEGEKVSVLRETATLWETRGNDKKRARRALGAAVRLDPDDAEVRSEFERLVAETKAWDEIARVYEETLAEKPDLPSKRELYAVLARVHDKERDDPRRALWAYGCLYDSDPSDPEPLDATERLAILLSDWPALVAVLTAKSESVLDDSERASLLRRVGEAKRDMLDDREGAIAAYERALELDPDSTFTIDCLVELHEAASNATRLVELYQRRVELTSDDDADQKFELLVAAAKTHEEKLADRLGAIDSYARALAVKPREKPVLEALNRLYRAESQWSELLSNLKTQVESAADAAERAALHKEIGRVQSDKLSNYEDALEAFRLALADAPSDDESIDAVRTLGKEHDSLRRTVAEILVPVLRQTERWGALADLLELRLSVETEPGERTQTLWAMAEIFENRLSKPADAESALLRAIGETPDAEDLHAEITRLSEVSGGFGRYADTLSERAAATFDADVARDLYVRLGKVAEERLAEHDRAVEAYERAVEQAGDLPELLAALDRLYTRLGRLDKTADVLERRVGLGSDAAAQADLHHRLADIQVTHFKDPARALGSLRAALDAVPGHAASVAALEKLSTDRDLFEESAELLEGVYRAQGDTSRLAGLYEKRVSFADGVEAKTAMRLRLARVLEQDARDPARGQSVVEQGLAEAPGDAGLLDELERLAAMTGGWTSAASALRDALEAHKDGIVPDVACSLSQRLAHWLRDHAKDAEAAEAALRRGLDFDSDNDDLLKELEELQRGSGRALDLVETLRRRAKLQTDEVQRADLYRQAKTLAEGRGDAGLAESILRELLQQDEANGWALAELTKLREAAQDYKETFALLVRQAETSVDPDAQRSLRRRAAAIARDRLNDAAGAAELYEELFEDDPTDADAATALRALYAASARFQELGRLLERLIDVADTPAKRSELRLELAKLSEEKFGSADTAIELVRAVLDEEPARAEAVVVLSELYERTKRDEELAELLASQIDAAQSRGDVAAELAFKVRLGEVYETRLGDRAQAIETYKGVLARDSSHRGALECLARLYATEGKLAESAETLNQLLGMSSGGEAVAYALELCAVQEKLGAHDAAASALERGLAAEPKNLDIRARLRKLYETNGAWEKLSALVAEDAEIAEAPADKVRLLRQAAKIQAEKRGDHAAAAELLERATRVSPDDRELLLALCDELNACGRGKAAAEVLERIVASYGTKRTKELAEIHRRLANAYLADDNGQRALEELDKAFRIEPGNIGVLSLLGEVALKVGDLKKAQQMYRALLLQKLDEGGPIKKAIVFVRLGDIHSRLGEKPKAVQMYERALQTDAALDEARAKLAEAKA